MTITHRPIDIHLGDWTAWGTHASEVRTAVFVHEQGIAPEDEWDALDATAWHAVALDPDGQAVATGRLLQDAPGVARVGRMAVLRSVRGTGVGRAVLQALMAAARARGDARVLLHAQRSAEAFYAAAGFVSDGAPFEECGIPHLPMARALD